MGTLIYRTSLQQAKHKGGSRPPIRTFGMGDVQEIAESLQHVTHSKGSDW